MVKPPHRIIGLTVAEVKGHLEELYKEQWDLDDKLERVKREIDELEEYMEQSISSLKFNGEKMQALLAIVHRHGSGYEQFLVESALEGNAVEDIGRLNILCIQFLNTTLE